MSRNSETGNILVSSLLILIVMNLLAVALVQSSISESKIATFNSVDAEVFHVTESCSQEVINWFKSQSTTPSTVPTVSESSLNFMYTGTESQSMLNKLAGYSYNCTTNYITSQVDTSDITNGGEVGNIDGSYNSNAYLSPRDYYQIVATGQGPKNSNRVTNTIISVEY